MRPLVVNPGGRLGVEDIVGREQEIQRYWKILERQGLVLGAERRLGKTHIVLKMHELGRDFCFVARQFRISVDAEDYYLDLLFYHRALQCLIAIDLKLGKFRHEYAGQMNFYLNYLKENVAYPHENPPVGILLCAEKDAEAVHYATAGMDNQLFVSRYLIALPSEEQLKQWLREEQSRLEQQFNATDRREP